MRPVLTIVSGAVVTAGLGASLLSQQAVPVTPVHTVRIDTVVVDGKGAAVSNLQASDFDLREDGKVPSIDDARFVGIHSDADAVGPGGAKVEGPQPVRSSADELREAHRDGTRLVAIYLDEYHIGAGVSVGRARDALTTFIDHTLRAGDLLVVMKPLDSLLTIRLGHDRDEARRIVSVLEGRKGDYTPRTAYERDSMVGSPARVEAARTQVTVSALQALAVHLGSLNDLRKTLLVVTEGLTHPARRRGQEYLATVDSVLRSANRANVSIYPFDPRPASAADGTSDDERAVLGSLSKDTDGGIVTGADDVGAALRDAVASASAYYILTYRAPHTEDGTFHSVQVRVRRAGVNVHARGGYWAPSPDDRLSAELLAKANAPRAPIRVEPARRISPLIQPWFGVSLGQGGNTRVTFVWEPAPRVPGDRGRRLPAWLDLTALDDEDAVLFEGSVRPSGPGMLEDQGGEPSRAVFDVPPGHIRLRMKILDTARREVDSDVREIAVRDLRREVSIGTPELRRARNAREFRAIDEDPSTSPVASREFSRAERLLIRFFAYAPDGQQPTVEARLLNRMGQPMRTLDIRRAGDGEHECDLALAGLASGDYQLELSANAAAGKARETVSFRVTS